MAPPWVEMWLLAFAIYAALKLLGWIEAGPWKVKVWRSAAYLLAWPGMDAHSFLRGERPIALPPHSEWLFAVAKFGTGVVLVMVAAQWHAAPSWLRAWLGMIGMVFSLHFGLFHLLSCLWRTAGIDAAPIMHWPIAATSLLDFWSRRWNLAFRDLTHRFLFRPLAGRWGAATALWTGFLISGVIHDLVISLPARGGYGLPTLFFLIQAAGISLERSRVGKSAGLGQGLIGWLWTAAVLIVPSPLMVHEAFRERVVIPMLESLQT